VQRGSPRKTIQTYACTTAHFQTASPSPFTSPKTTRPWPIGSKVWRLLFGSAVYGPTTKTFSRNVRVALLRALTVAADESFIHSLTSCLKSPSFKSWSSLADTYSISIQNTTASSILLSNIGGQRSSVSVQQGARQLLRRWRRKSSNPLMTSPSCTFGGESFVFCSYPPQ
jgi:hypothetical protein